MSNALIDVALEADLLTTVEITETITITVPPSAATGNIEVIKRSLSESDDGLVSPVSGSSTFTSTKDVAIAVGVTVAIVLVLIIVVGRWYLVRRKRLAHSLYNQYNNNMQLHAPSANEDTQFKYQTRVMYNPEKRLKVQDTLDTLKEIPAAKQTHNAITYWSQRMSKRASLFFRAANSSNSDTRGTNSSYTTTGASLSTGELSIGSSQNLALKEFKLNQPPSTENRIQKRDPVYIGDLAKIDNRYQDQITRQVLTQNVNDGGRCHKPTTKPVILKEIRLINSAKSVGSEF